MIRCFAFSIALIATAWGQSALTEIASDDPEIDAMMAVDGATIGGVAYLTLCESAMVANYAPLWQAHRIRIIRNIEEIIPDPDRALLRYDELEANSRASLQRYEQDSSAISPRISDPMTCMNHLSNNEHETDVAVAKLRQIRANPSSP